MLSLGTRSVSPFRLRWTLAVVVAGSVVAGVLAKGLLPSFCIVRGSTGWDCPFCGGSRALAALMRADVLGALDFNAFTVLVVVPLAAAAVVLLGLWESGRIRRLWPSGGTGTAFAVLLTVSMFTWTVLRNLPFAPFTALAAEV